MPKGKQKQLETTKERISSSRVREKWFHIWSALGTALNWQPGGEKERENSSYDNEKYLCL